MNSLTFFFFCFALHISCVMLRTEFIFSPFLHILSVPHVHSCVFSTEHELSHCSCKTPQTQHEIGKVAALDQTRWPLTALNIPTSVTPSWERQTDLCWEDNSRVGMSVTVSTLSSTASNPRVDRCPPSPSPRLFPSKESFLFEFREEEHR